jgi:hypothetical protein
MKSFMRFIDESYGKFIPLDIKNPTAFENILSARRKAEASARGKSNVENRRVFHELPKSMKAKMILAGSPEMSKEDAMKKASAQMGRRKRGVTESHNIKTLKGIPTPRLRKLHAKYKAKGTKEASREAATIGRILSSRVNEAISTNDPNRGRMGRKKPLVPQGMMPDDTRNPRTGNPVRTLGKLHSRLDKLSPETRTKYRQNYGYRTRVAGRGRRLYPSP